MFWRLLEYAFILLAILAGSRLVYLLWEGPKRHDAKQELDQAEEAVDVAQVERNAKIARDRAEEVRRNTNPNKESRRNE